jgi:uncharacterized protein with HEPN domain
MPHDVRDSGRLWDMLDSARAIVEFIDGLKYDDLLSDRKLRNAIERNLEIIGEAARNVSADARKQHPDIPWSSIIGLRNVIAHEYGEIQYEKIWSVCTIRLPILIEQLDKTDIENPPEME